MAEREPHEEAAQPGTEITPELVRQVTEKVYALWLQDLKIARERRRMHRRRNGNGRS